MSEKDFIQRRTRRAKRATTPGDVAPRPKLRDVAALAGVSTASVSRALNSPSVVSDALRVRVTAAVAELGYVPNDAGRALASLRTGLIGVVVPAIEDPATALMLAGIEGRLAEAGYMVIVVAATAADVESTVRRLLARDVEALMLLGRMPSPAVDALVATRRVPVIYSGARIAGANSVGLDLTQATTTISRYLHEHGHRRFALIAGTFARGTQGAACGDALRAALQALPGSTLVELTAPPFGFDEARTGVGRWLAIARRPTAIVCTDDTLAAGAVRACALAQVAVPADMSVIGFGDHAVARQTQPPLTTLRDPVGDVGRAAAAQVLAQIGGAAEAATAIATRLIVRGTSGQAPH